MQNTKFLSKEIFLKEVSLFFKYLESFSLRKNSNLLFSKNDIVHLTENKLYSLFALNDKTINVEIARAILPLLKNACHKAESVSSKSTEILIPFVCNLLKKIQNIDSFEFKNKSNIFLNSLEEELPNYISYPEWENVEKIIEDILQDKKLYNLVNEALKLAGIEGKIFVEGSKINKDFVELSNGYNFNLKTYNFLLDSNKKWQANYAKCCVIDGIVANVHEIDQLLTKATETKEPLVIFAKGFENEILNTVNLNNKRGTFNIFLIKVDLEIESLNIINDIAVVCGTDIVSTLKGNALTFIKYEDLPIVDYISCFKDNILIKNEKVHSRVQISIDSLIKSRDSQTDETIIKLFNNRIRALTSNFVIIKVSSSSAQERLFKVEKIDEALRSIKSILTTGTFDTNYSSKMLSNMNIDSTLKEAFLSALKENRIYAGSSIASAMKYAISFINSIISIHGALLLDE